MRSACGIARGDSQDTKNEAEENREVERGGACGDGKGGSRKGMLILEKSRGVCEQNFWIKW